MHVSLDSALGRQRRLNSVGESVLQIAPSAAAAYSLRSLTGGDPKVVRVRRGSDNHEQDFTASEVSSGALTSFVNAQVVAPLDIQALSATGRDGDFLIAKAAYSLRSLGTRQATLAATGDTVARADGKFVAQVRRSSDDALKSFTADEVTDGTLLAFVGTGGSDNGFVKTWYDQSVTNQAGDTATGNHATQATAAEQPKIVNAGALLADGLTFDGSDDVLFTTSAISSTNIAIACVSKSANNATAGIFSMLDAPNDGHELLYLADKIRLATNNDDLNVTATITNQNLYFANYDGSTQTLSVNGTVSTAASSRTISVTQLAQIGQRRGGNPLNGSIEEIIVYTSDQTANRTAIEGNLGEAYSIDLPSGVDPGFDQVDGFVETWYDQSGNNRPLIQTTASEQPLIVEAGTFLNGVKANQATSNDTMQNLQVSTDGTNANFGTDDWASGASSKLGAVYVGTVPAASVATSSQNSTIWGGSRGVGAFQEGGVALSVVKAGTDSWRLRNERQGLSPSTMDCRVSLNTDADVVLYGTTDNREFTINVNGSGNTETESADLDVREGQALSLFGAYNGTDGRYYQRSAGGVCKECYLYAGDPVANIPALATSINSHYSIY